MKYTKPFFSIVIATYNRVDLLKRAIESVLAQTDVEWELLIIDDGSTDATRQLVVLYQSNHANIRYYWQENSGVASAKNKGMQYAIGKYITFLDSDDFYLSDHLVNRKDVLLEFPDIDLLYGGVQIIGDEYVPDRNKEGERIHLSKCVMGATFFIKREVIEVLEGFRKLPIGTDADLFERATGAKYNIKKVDYPSYVYDRSHNDSITKNFSRQ